LAGPKKGPFSQSENREGKMGAFKQPFSKAGEMSCTRQDLLESRWRNNPTLLRSVVFLFCRLLWIVDRHAD